MSTLYRDYRPKNFNEIFSQNHVKITLENQIQTGKIAHAYLFCGPRGIGKTTFARVFAKAVNCTERKEGDYEPCDKCDICKETIAGANIDLIEIDAASHTGVDNVRENIIANARIQPSRSKYKIFIIDEVHMLSVSAFNALLKIIEEPPKYVIFILCTTEAHKVPATIISRCQRFDFTRISVNDIVKKLSYIAKQEKIKIDKKILESIARQSEGHLRDAESIFGQIIAIGGKEITQEEADLVIPRSNLNEIINLLESLQKKDCFNGIKLINNLVDNGVDLKNFCNELIEVLRKMLLSKINPILSEKIGIEYGENYDIKISDLTKILNLNQIIFFIEKFSDIGNKLKNAHIIQLPFELALAEICASQDNLAPLTGLDKKPLLAENLNKNKQANVNKSSAKLNKEAIASKWNEVLIKIKKYNHSLSFILRVCEPREFNDGKLFLAFKYKFHKDRVSDAQIKTLVEKVVSEVYGVDILIEPIIDETMDVNSNSLVSEENKEINGDGSVGRGQEEKKSDNNDQMINNILNTFGGKVVG